MNQFYNLLTKTKHEKKRDTLIEDYIRKSETKYKELIQRYKLWVEYLKRSSNYKNVCDWFSRTKQDIPYPDEIQKYDLKPTGLEDYIFYAVSYERLRSDSPYLPLKNLLPHVELMFTKLKPFEDMFSDTFFLWAMNAGFPSRFGFEMLMNLFVFGDIFRDPPQMTTLRIMHLINGRNKARAFRSEEIIDLLFSHIEREMFQDNVPSLDAFKHALKRVLKSNILLSICLVDPFEDADLTVKQIKRLINERREFISKSRNKPDWFDFFKPDQFEYPASKNFRLDDLKKHLQLYDIKQDGMRVRPQDYWVHI
jgi:hypothetical protein